MGTQPHSREMPSLRQQNTETAKTKKLRCEQTVNQDVERLWNAWSLVHCYSVKTSSVTQVDQSSVA